MTAEDAGAPKPDPTRRRGVHRFRRVFQLAFLALYAGLLAWTFWPLGKVFLGSVTVPYSCLQDVKNLRDKRRNG